MSQASNQAASSIAGVQLEGTDLSKLLSKEFKVKSSETQERVESAVKTLAQMALENTKVVGDDALKSIEAMIAAIDRKLSEQLNEVMHHEDFRRLEASWRGLSYLVNNTETDETLKIRVLNISKKEVGKTLSRFKGAAWDQSPLFKKLYEDEYGMPGGQPYGAIVGDYQFDHSAPDIELMSGMSQIAAAAHAPFLAAAGPTLMGMDSWQELHNPRDLTKIFQSAEYAPWRSLRASDDARYLGLCMPRFLSRLPYGSKTNPVDEFAFEEDTDGKAHDKYVWSNAAYAMATNITRSFKLYGWCANIRGTESGGIVEGLPCHTFPSDDGGVDMKCPTEIGITDRREAELAKNGLIPLSHYKNTDYAVFMGAQSLQQPQEYTDPDATANARLSARLPYLFAVNRFAHFLKCMVRDKIGSFKERSDMEKWLNDWIAQYVTVDPNASEEVKARYPLAAAQVEVLEVPGNPGYYTSKFYLRPHYQLEGLTVSLRLVSKLPSVKKGGG
jgi:type VI secretion system protein ImpC